MLAHIVFVWSVLASLACPSSSDELRDVWHHTNPVAKVTRARAESDPSSQVSNLRDFISRKKQQSPDNNSTKVRATKMFETKLEDGNSTKQECDLLGQHMRIAVSLQPPFVNCLQDLFGEWLCNGSNIEVIHVLERRLNFNAEWVVLAEGHHDDDIPSRTSTSGSQARRKTPKERSGRNDESTRSNVPATSSVFNLVASGRALMSANGVVKTLDRSDRNLIVSEPFDSFRFHLLLSKSVRDHDHIFIKPFDPQAWLAILLSAGLIVPIFYLINTTSHHYSIQDDRPLRKLSVWQCVSWKVKELYCALIPTRRRRLSSSSSLDEELSKVFQLENRAASAAELVLSDARLGSELALVRAIPLRGESKRRRRLAKHQWAYERRQAVKLGRKKRQSGFFKVAYIIWYVVASLANQGGETEDLPHANSTRILVAFWWLYLIVICAIHSGILTAILTFPKQNDFIQTLDDYLSLELAERNSLRLSVDKYSELAQLLVNYDNLHKSPLQQLHNQSVPIAFVNFQRHRQRILDEVQQGKNAFMEEKSTIRQIISDDFYDSRQSKCLFKSSRYPIDVIPMSLILNKNMPPACIETINKALRRIMKTGLAQKWRRNYESPGNDCLNTVAFNAGDVDKIELKHVMLALWLLALGALIGLLFLVAEIGWLFMIEDENDDSSSVSSMSEFSSSSDSSSSLNTSSDESDHIQLGFRRAIIPSSEQLKSIRSLQTKRLPVRAILRKNRRRNRRSIGPVPRVIFSAEMMAEDRQTASDDSDQDSVRVSSFVIDEREGFKEFKEFRARHQEERRAQRTAKQAEKRAKRVQKTVELLKRLHGGKIYSDKLKNRVRRMSHSVMGHLTHHSQVPKTHANEPGTPGNRDPNTMRRRRFLHAPRVSP